MEIYCATQFDTCVTSICMFISLFSFSKPTRNRVQCASPKMTFSVLVTGANGFLGQHVVKHLQERAKDHVDSLILLDKEPFVQKLGILTMYCYTAVMTQLHDVRGILNRKAVIIIITIAFGLSKKIEITEVHLLNFVVKGLPIITIYSYFMYSATLFMYYSVIGTY